MGWTASKIFSAYMHDVLGNVTAMDIDTDASIKVALFNDTITPSQVVSAANSAYGAGVWASGGVSDTNWPAAGLALAWGSATRFSTNAAISWALHSRGNICTMSRACASGTWPDCTCCQRGSSGPHRWNRP